MITNCDHDQMTTRKEHTH